MVTIFKGSNNTVFILLPVFVYFAATQFQRYNFKLPSFALDLLLTATPIYLLLTICLAFIYYGAITGVELLLHPSPTVDRIILITTALTWTIILDPVRVYFQKGIERRFNLRNREAVNMFDYARIEVLIGEHPGGPTLIDFLLSELATFTGSEWEQEDDVTMVTLRRDSISGH
jgi:hypothetical protein